MFLFQQTLKYTPYRLCLYRQTISLDHLFLYASIRAFYTSYIMLNRKRIIDFIDEYGSIPKKEEVNKCHEVYEKLMTNNVHMILTNTPIDTPFAFTENGLLPLETKWIYRGKGIGHGYNDEYRIDKVFNAFEKQKKSLVEQGVEADLPVDYLNVLEAAGVPTNSFVIGIERLVKDLFANASEN